MFTKLEQRSWIKTEMARTRSTQECFQGLRESCSDAALPYRAMAQWLKAFRSGQPPYRVTPRGEHSSTSCFPVGG